MGAAIVGLGLVLSAGVTVRITLVEAETRITAIGIDLVISRKRVGIVLALTFSMARAINWGYFRVGQ